MLTPVCATIDVVREQELPAAIDTLYAAVSRLVDNRKELHQDVVRVAPSLYDTLVSEIPAAKNSGEKYRCGVASSRPLVWCDAVDLRTTIDETVRGWARRRTTKLPADGKFRSSTPELLRAVAAHRYRPQDVDTVADRAAVVGSWSVQINGLLEPERVKTISAACPACGTRTVYREYAGETVRQAALQIVGTAGCTCLACSASWAPDQYLFLCRLLGFELPEGVLA